MQEGVMQSFVLIPGWVLADPLLSPPRTVGTISHISTAEFPCYGLPIFWRDKEASTNLILLPSPVFPWREERYPGQRAHWAQQTHYTRIPGTVSRLWIESALFLPCVLLSDDTTIEKVLLGSTHLPNKGAHAGKQLGYVLAAAASLLSLWRRDKDILGVPSTETGRQEPGRLPR